MAKPVLVKLGMYIMANEPISTAFLISSFHQSVCLYVNLLTVPTQRIGKDVTTATKTHATIEEFLDASFSIRSCRINGKQAISFSQNFLF
jgi:hypothetical protein